MPLITWALGLIFLLPFSSFAQEAKEKLCQQRISEIAVVDGHIKNYFQKNGDPYESFIKQVNLKQQLERLTSAPEKITKKEQLKEINYSVMSELDVSCQKYYASLKSEKEEEIDQSAKGECDEKIMNFLTDSNYKQQVVKTLDQNLQKHSDAIKALQEKSEFKSLKNLKQFIALDVLDNCDLTSDKKETLKEVACGKSLEGVPSDGLSKHVTDNMTIVNELNKKLNKIDLATIEKNCHDIVEKYHYTVDEFPTCKQRLEEQKHRLSEIKRLQQEKLEQDQFLALKEEKKDKKEKKKIERKKQREYYLNKYHNDVYAKYDHSSSQKNYRSSYHKSSSAKTNKTLKTVAMVIGAVGFSGMIGYGMYKLFDNTHTSSYVAPVNNYTYPRNFYSYQMSPTESYQYQQFMMNSYQQNTNSWIGYTPDATNTPYTFEFGN